MLNERPDWLHRETYKALKSKEVTKLVLFSFQENALSAYAIKTKPANRDNLQVSGLVSGCYQFKTTST